MPQTSDAAVVTAAATYFPSCARPTRRGTVTVCNGDEDAITLAVAAGLDCVPAATRPVEQVYVILGNSPLQVGPIAEVVREALSLSADVACSAILEDELGAMTALLSAIDQVTLGRAASALVVAAEQGDGRQVAASAVALLVEPAADRGGIAVGGIRSEGTVIYGTWSRDQDGTRGRADPRFLDTARTGPVVRLLERLGARAGEAGALAISGTLIPAVRDKLPRELPAVAVGDAGVTGPLLALLAGARLAGNQPFLSLSTSAARTALVQASLSGEADWLPATSAPETTPQAPEQAASPALSLPASSPFFARSARELLRLEAGKCDTCGHLVFPPSQRPVCASCGGSGWIPYQISRSGTVYTFTVNRFLPAGFDTQMVMILGEMADGTRYWAPGSGITATDVCIGMQVELSVRRYTRDGGIPVYAMKFTPPRRPAAIATAPEPECA